MASRTSSPTAGERRPQWECAFDTADQERRVAPPKPSSCATTAATTTARAGSSAQCSTQHKSELQRAGCIAPDAMIRVVNELQHNATVGNTMYCNDMCESAGTAPCCGASCSSRDDCSAPEQNCFEPWTEAGFFGCVTGHYVCCCDGGR
eukprot:COSAG05_NODE_2113_length_3545_cov_82.901335_5_plen_149_part_00